MNDYRQLLVHLDDSAHNIPGLRAARAIAQAHGAAVAACYAVTSSVLDAPYSGTIAPQLVADLVRWDEERLQRARKAFDLEVREPGPVPTWSNVSGLGAAGEFARLALYADLVVLRQDDPANPAGVPADFNETVILASGKPALVIPYTGWTRAIGQTAVIAWKETPQAARAVAAALPLLRRARRVHVLQWGKQDESAVNGHGLDLKGYLGLHEIEPVWHDGGDEPSAVGELALSRAFDLDADLLVMGCYGHSRARELLLGGMSRTLLKSMTLPVLMAH